MSLQPSMRTSFEVLLVLSAITCVGAIATEGLSESERDQFYNNNDYEGEVTLTEHDTHYVIEANGLPDHEVEQKNRNEATAQDFSFTFKKEIEFACIPGSLPKGPIAITKTGVAIYNPLSSTDENAVEGDGKERFDQCNGHADRNKIYHYHQSPAGTANCGDIRTNEPDEFIGVALDGFPIYGSYASDKGVEPLTSADLDKCHGRMVDGKYRYHLTTDFPYVLGCFWGADAKVNSRRVSYACDSNVGTDLPELGYLCSNVTERKRAVVCDHYPGTVEVTTMGTRNLVDTPVPTMKKRPPPKTGGPKLREYTPSPLRERNGGFRLRENTPSPLRERNGGFRLRENTPSPLRERNGGFRLRENTPSPLREAYLKRWLKDLLKQST